MSKTSAGLIMYRRKNNVLEVLLVHPGGPFFAKKDQGFWGIPKGEIDEIDEDYLAAAKREFKEETGIAPPEANTYIPLGSIVQKGGKTVHAWAFEGDCEPKKITSNTFILEWPPRSGKEQEFPEIDQAEFFTIEKAREKIKPAQFELLERLQKALA